MPQDKMRRTLLDRVQMYEFAVIEATCTLTPTRRTRTP